MNIINEVRAFFGVKSLVSQGYKEAQAMNGVKPGWKTTEFWMTVATVYLPTLWGYAHSFVPPTVAMEITVGATAVYTIGRTIVKALADFKAVRTATSGNPAVAVAVAP